jgi:NTP pyrophosphatase (non-canonical NTP hydrolase)
MMTEREYTQEVLRTCAEPDHLQRLILGAMGLAGESGEVVDVIKKTHIQGHALDVEKLIDELGDVLWYLALLCDTPGIALQDMRIGNVLQGYAEFQASFEEMQDADTQETDDRPNLDQDTDTTPKKLTQVPASERMSLDGTSSTNTLGFLPSRSYSTREGGDWQPEGGPYARMSLS